ncbi:MAG: L,D-transpeptidase family protein [Balneolia bacterium]|nr:L,D-transpeptidase family protein [Balneolia bacterium]
MLSKSISPFFIGLLFALPLHAQNNEAAHAAILESSSSINSQATDTPVQIELSERLRHRIEAQPVERGALEVGGQVLFSQRSLPQFYIDNGFQPLWLGEGNEERLNQVVEVIRTSYRHGFNPDSYHYDRIETLMSIYENPANLSTRAQADLELLLTDGFILMTSHLIAGQLDPLTFDPNWHVVRDEVDYINLLNSVREGEEVSAVVERVQPQHRRYGFLMDALEKYREISRNGGWPQVPEGATLRPGMEDDRIPALRKRLLLAGDLHGDEPDEEAMDSRVYDDQLREAVLRFQRRHGLDADAVIGRNTYAALNTPVEDRIIQAMVNLERWRWLKQDLGENHVLVNIANFSVEVVEQGETVMDMRAIVGRQYRQTPVFSSRMTYLVLSPYWHLPPGIVRNDIIPRLRQNPNHTREQNIKIFDGWGANAQEVDPESVNWSESGVAGRYRFRQEPGPANALGDVKFMFPNQFHVYLHDTPARDLFGRTQRDFSSGCIRIDKPLEFAEYLLRNDSRWNRSAINDVIRQRRERTVTLPQAVWVHILYWTAWAEPDGTIHFRNDIYQRDRRLIEAIQAEMETPLTLIEHTE